MLLWTRPTYIPVGHLDDNLQKAGQSTVWIAVTLFTGLLTAAPAYARSPDTLISLINAYRAAPGSCEGRSASPAKPLTSHPALANVHIAPGTFLQQMLESAGYAFERAEAIHVTGPFDAKSVMTTIQQKYCVTLLSTNYSAIGVYRTGDNWQIVLAQPTQPSPRSMLPDWQETGKAILNAVNAARATTRTCGNQRFPAVPAVGWNSDLGDAALAHSQDMARQKYFSHKGKDGSGATDRVSRAGYRWQRIGENIASGQNSVEEVVAGWLASPGHCANIMNSDFTEMGAAYAIDNERSSGNIYWTQVFGTPR